MKQKPYSKGFQIAGGIHAYGKIHVFCIFSAYAVLTLHFGRFLQRKFLYMKFMPWAWELYESFHFNNFEKTRLVYTTISQLLGLSVSNKPI